MHVRRVLDGVGTEGSVFLLLVCRAVLCCMMFKHASASFAVRMRSFRARKVERARKGQRQPR